MDNKEAIEIIKSNWPPVQYTVLREALEKALNSLDENPDAIMKERSTGC